MTRAPRPGASATADGSLVTQVPPATPDAALAHFRSRLAFETDPADLHSDLERGSASIVVIDTRASHAFEAAHIPGALNLPHREITEETTASLARDAVYVTYCWGPGCNAATRGAARLAQLGFRVKELIGGLEYWKREGYAVE